MEVTNPTSTKNRKKIVYTIVSNGIDGREKDMVVFASYDEEERDEWYENAKGKPWFRKAEQIVDPVTEKKNTLRRLNGIEKLMLELEQTEG